MLLCGVAVVDLQMFCAECFYTRKNIYIENEELYNRKHLIRTNIKMGKLKFYGCPQ
jgi:hypothetical protein